MMLKIHLNLFITLLLGSKTVVSYPNSAGCQPIPIFLLNSYILGPNPIFLSYKFSYILKIFPIFLGKFVADE